VLTSFLGKTGVKVSRIALGAMSFGGDADEATAAQIWRAARDAGVNLIDTADVYNEGRSEEIVGRLAREERDRIILASKAYFPTARDPNARGSSRYHLVRAVEASLRRLATDRIDLYYLHRFDDATDLGETLRALDDLVRQGKVLHVASSNVDAAQIDEAAKVATDRGLRRFVGTQIEWNLLERGVEAEVVPAARRNSVGIVPYFPLASGMLTGKYRKGEDYPEGSRFTMMGGYFAKIATDDNFARVEELSVIADAHGRSVLELAIAWLAAQDGVASVIAGATTADQVRANAAGAEWVLTPEDLAAIG
jgi:aryl-alcohol dehydrogenase-like predicted oxidoreductase